MLVVQRLAGVLLQVQALDPDRHRVAAVGVDHHFAFAHDRRLELADLIALRQVGIEIVLAVEHRPQIDLGLQPEPGADRLPDALLVDHRQHAGHRRVDQRHVGVRLAAESGRRAGEQLRLRGDLGVNLQTDDHFPVAGRAFDQFRRVLLNAHGMPRCPPIARPAARVKVAGCSRRAGAVAFGSTVKTRGTTAPVASSRSEWRTPLLTRRRFAGSLAASALDVETIRSPGSCANLAEPARAVHLPDRARRQHRRGRAPRRRPSRRDLAAADRGREPHRQCQYRCRGSRAVRARRLHDLRPSLEPRGRAFCCPARRPTIRSQTSLRSR